MSRKYKFRNSEGIYFISTSIVNWVDVFTRIEYKTILIDSLSYCQKEKGLIIYAYVIMSNHFHLLVSKENDEINFSDIFRDLKKYTAMQIIKNIQENLQESRKEWMIQLFKEAGDNNSQNKQFQFWQQNNQPTEIDRDDGIDKVLNYIHDNPVKAGWVSEPEDYLYSSARNYTGRESPMKIISIFDGSII